MMGGFHLRREGDFMRNSRVLVIRANSPDCFAAWSFGRSAGSLFARRQGVLKEISLDDPNAFT
jgi:hypothetical protein